MTEPLTDKEFITEIRRGIIIIIRAMIRKYCLSWLDFFPKDVMLFREVPEAVDVTERSQ